MTVLDEILLQRGLTDDEIHAFKKSFIPTYKNSFQVFARIERTEKYRDLCLRPKDLTRWRSALTERGLQNNAVIGEILAAMELKSDVEVRFRTY